MQPGPVLNLPSAKLNVIPIGELPFMSTLTSTDPTNSPSGINGCASFPKSRCETSACPLHSFFAVSKSNRDSIIPPLSFARAFLISTFPLSIRYITGMFISVIFILSITVIESDFAFIEMLSWGRVLPFTFTTAKPFAIPDISGI